MGTPSPSPLKRGGSPIFGEPHKISKSDLSSEDESESDSDFNDTVIQKEDNWFIQSKSKLPKKARSNKSLKSPSNNANGKNTNNTDLDSASGMFPVIIEDIGSENDPRYRSYGQFTTGLFKSVEINDVSHQKRLSINKWIVYLKSESSQTKLLQVKDLGGIKINCSTPQRRAVGVIKPIPVGISMAQIQAACPDVKEAYRLKRKDGNESSAVKVIFATNELPPKMKIGNEYMNVDVYVDPVLRCSKCQKIGHKKSSCRSKQTLCPRCGKDAHDVSNAENNIKLCKVPESERFCINCKVKGHSSAWKGCPSQKFQKQINSEAARSGIPKGVIKSDIVSDLHETKKLTVPSSQNVPFMLTSISKSKSNYFHSNRHVTDTLSFSNVVKGDSQNESGKKESANDQNILEAMNKMLSVFEQKIDDKLRKFELKLSAKQIERQDKIKVIHENSQKERDSNPVKHCIVEIVKNVVLASEGNPQPLVHCIQSLLIPHFPSSGQRSKVCDWDADLKTLMQLVLPNHCDS